MHYRQIKEKCFHNYNNHKAIEILCCESKNSKDKVVHLFKVTRIFWFLYTALICVAAPMNMYRHRHFDIFANTLSYLFMIGHLNINSMRSKFVLAENNIKAFDIFLISESKLVCTFPLNQFLQDLNNLDEIEIDLEVIWCYTLMKIFLVDP